MPKIVTQENVIGRFVELHKDTYNYSLTRYVEMRQNVEIICPVHGSFWQLPKVHLSGSGCPDCAQTGFNPQKPALLYYLLHEESQLYKSGITNRTLLKRFQGRLKEFIVVDVKAFAIGADAYKREQEILKEHKEHRVTLDSFVGNGGTEFFDINVLDL